MANIHSLDAINDGNGSVLLITEKQKSLPRRLLSAFSYVTVEPIFFVSYVVILMYSMLAKEYIFARLASEYGLQNYTENRYGSGCNKSDTNQSSPHYYLEKKVSAETSNWVLYTFISGMVPSIFSTVLLGSWSDRVGRKVPLLISTFGFNILIAVYILVINLNLPLPVLFVGHIMCGLCGDFSAVLACGFSHLADISSMKWRTFRYAIVEACIGFGGITASLSGGVWANARGFKQPYWFLLGICLCNVFYVFLRFEGRHGQWIENLRFLGSFKPFIQAYRVLTLKDNTHRQTRIILYTVCFIIALMVLTGVQAVIVIYELGLPFCLQYSIVGYLMAFSQLGYFISTIGIRVFQKFTSEIWIVMIGVISNISSLVVLAFAQLAWHIVFSLSLMMLAFVITPVLRSQVSKTVDEHEVGSILALLACSQSVASVIANLIFNNIFSATVNFVYPGVVFLAGVALYVVFIPLYCIVYKMSKPNLHSSEEITYEPVSN